MLRCVWTLRGLVTTLLAGASIAMAAPVAAQTPAACAPVTKDAIAAVSTAWTEALTRGDLDGVLKLYADDAVLLPVMSNEPRVGMAAIRNYFSTYLDRHPAGQINMRSITIGCNFASDLGTATTRVTGARKGTRMADHMRYSIVYAFRDGRWVIVHHHISPEMAAGQ